MLVPATASTAVVDSATRAARLLAHAGVREVSRDSLLLALLGTILRTLYSPVLGCQRGSARESHGGGERVRGCRAPAMGGTRGGSCTRNRHQRWSDRTRSRPSVTRR